MSNPIYPCLWFDNQAEVAAKFYISVFKNGSITSSNSIVVTIDVHDQKFMLLNGGLKFKINPSMSFYMVCESKREIDELWSELEQEGKVMMPLNKYPWSEKYGWVQDRYGVSWQLTLGNLAEMGQKFTPALMFTGPQFGNAEPAINRYIEIFNDSTIHFISRYVDTDPQQGGKIQHSQFSLEGRKFIAMDSGLFHDFSFTEGLSLVVECESQEEIDHYWNKLTDGGEESQCGWLKDAYGLSWQIVPSILGKLLQDAERAPKVTEAFLKMKKFDIATLLKA